MADFVPEVEDEDDAVTSQPQIVQNDQEMAENPAETDKNFTRRFLNEKWYGKYGEGDLLEHIGQEWKPVDPDMVELLSQLWFEQEEQEKKANEHYDWDAEKNEWVPKAVTEKKEEVNEDFIAKYQANYGVQYDDIYKKMDEEIHQKAAAALKEEEERKARKKRKKMGLGAENKEDGWVDRSDKVHAVYVSNLPTEITDEEFTQFMSKCGVIQSDFRTSKPKCKLYRTEDGELKGDGRCCYIKKESVDLACEILDGTLLNGKEVKVEEAHFEMKGDFDPSKKKKRLTEAQKKLYREQQNKIFEWVPDKPRNYRPKSDCTVIVKNLFTLEAMEKNPALMLDLKEEMQKSCEKYGQVKKVVVYDTHPDGVVSVTFLTTDESDNAVKYLNGRVVDGRTLSADLWDGKTKYKMEESEEAAERRLKAYHEHIGAKEDSDEDEEDAN